MVTRQVCLKINTLSRVCSCSIVCSMVTRQVCLKINTLSRVCSCSIVCSMVTRQVCLKINTLSRVCSWKYGKYCVSASPIQLGLRPHWIGTQKRKFFPYSTRACVITCSSKCWIICNTKRYITCTVVRISLLLWHRDPDVIELVQNKRSKLCWPEQGYQPDYHVIYVSFVTGIPFKQYIC